MLPNRHNLAKPDTSHPAGNIAISIVCELITDDYLHATLHSADQAIREGVWMSRLKPAQELSPGQGGVLIEPCLEIIGHLGQGVRAASTSGDWRLLPRCWPDFALLPRIAQAVKEGFDVRLGVITIRGGRRISQRRQPSLRLADLMEQPDRVKVTELRR